jgi:hypothetical protein
MDDRFDEMKDKARDKAEEAKNDPGEVFNRDKESSEDDEQGGGLMDDLKERGQDAASKLRDRGE